MAFMNPSDMVEEDAADLQFPKEITSINSISSSTINHKSPKQSHISEIRYSTEHCISCSTELIQPFIKCAECSNKLCLKCFSSGAEIENHLNTHPYIIIHDNIQVFPSSNWTGAEEKKLLQLLSTCGYGNWEDIAADMGNRSADECKDHYHSCYFNGIFQKLLGLTNDFYFPERNPYICKMKSIDPPRHDFDSMNFKNMAGYRYARGDFDIPFDNSAEIIVSNLNTEVTWPKNYEEARKTLQCAIFRSFNNRLIERTRRYKIMQSHGLLMANKTLGWLSMFSEALSTPQRNAKFTITGRFVAFMQLMDGIAFDYLVESLQNYTELKKYLFKLYEMRSNGIKTFSGINIYQRLKHKRMSKLRHKRMEQYRSHLNWRNLVPNLSQSGSIVFHNGVTTFNQPRKKAAPIDVLGLPGYDKLTEEERNLCSTSRIVPVAYLEYKNILLAENAKVGCLRLADARRIIKIDVNKTRQIYDFLVNNGFINKPY